MPKSIMEYEPRYYNLTDEKDRWDGFPLKNLAEYLQRNLWPGAKILDIGCGTASVLKFLPKTVYYTGFDQSEFAIEKAKRTWVSYPNVNFLAHTGPQAPFGDESFDMALLIFSLEHLKYPKEILGECGRMLKKGGAVVVLAPNLEFPFAWPNALRHKNLLYRIIFTILRVLDYLKRVLGIYSFRVLAENITSEKRIYERKDDDLWHMVSSWEVIKFLENKGLTLEELWKDSLAGQVGKKLTGWRKLLTFLPALRWYGMTLAVVFRKR